MTSFMSLPTLDPIPFGEPYQMFTRISIETCGMCTRDCWFCPAHEREQKLNPMTTELYDKICRELSELSFDGVVQWFFVNEPLLDRKWRERITQLRAEVPLCTIHVTTNWDTMYKKSQAYQLEMIERLFDAGVNSLNLNDYDNRGYKELVKLTGRPIEEHCWKRIGPRKKVLSTSLGPEAEGTVHSWSGHNKSNMGGGGRCARPMRHIVVMWNGQVPLCCAVNPRTCETLGDINLQSLTEVWDSRRMFEYRHNLQQGVRANDCTNCDEKMAFPHIVRKVRL